MKKLSHLSEQVEELSSLGARAGSLEELLTLAIEERDDSLAGTFAEELAAVAGLLKGMELRLALSGPYDGRNPIAAIHAGAGGVESQDWVRMLLRMYLRWGEARGFDNEVLDVSPGEEGGIKSVVFQLNGASAYGYMKGERGVHRLVRISPFDGAHSRHTSFALVEVMPEAESDVDVTINPDDLRIDYFKASGAGGQNVQKNSTAVRVVHLPTNIIVAVQNERSQRQNRETAMKILRSRLMEIELQKRAEEQAKIKGEHISAAWGNQIRSYVLHPYKLVKDHRTGLESRSPNDVLDGDLDELINAYLKYSVGQG